MYPLSRFVGIKVISMGRPFRGSSILLLNGIAQIILVFCAIIPATCNDVEHLKSKEFFVL
ncbi:MAG: hypothetical protein ACLFQS_10575 [Bacteroidales bacterium]